MTTSLHCRYRFRLEGKRSGSQAADRQGHLTLALVALIAVGVLQWRCCVEVTQGIVLPDQESK